MYIDLLEGIALVIACIVSALLGLRWVHKHLPLLDRIENNEVAGFIYGTLGVVYAVLLAFVVIVEWESLTSAEHVVQNEANALIDLARNTRAWPDSVQANMENVVQRYVRLVVNEEWELMKHGIESETAHQAIHQIWDAVGSLKAETPEQVARLPMVIQKINDANDQRRLRLLATREGIPTVMWVLLIGGGIVTISFTFLFGTKHVKLQMYKTAALAGMVSFVLFLVMLLNKPFSSGMSVNNESFKHILEHLEGGWKANTTLPHSEGH